jgi:hypothetical protein
MLCVHCVTTRGGGGTQGIGKVHAKWNPVCVATFQLEPEIKLDAGTCVQHAGISGTRQVSLSLSRADQNYAAVWRRAHGDADAGAEEKICGRVPAGRV